jgi:UDP-N-acetylmuramoyl-L-alanyl-D-glutamate--2,6-diaminopimelate ligase
MLSETVEKPQGNPRLAVLNRDDSSYSYLSAYISQFSRVRLISYGLAPQSDVWAENVQLSPTHINFETMTKEHRFRVQSPLVGFYNVSNCLAALAVTVGGLGISYFDAQRGIAGLSGIPGRMERIEVGQAFLAIVDFAHTPNALRVSLDAVRKMTSGKVIAVFGSAGLRDREKRRMMAETSQNMADVTILTAEDPRTEDLDCILAEMASGAAAQGGKEGKTFWRIRDRGEALRFAVSLAKPGDVVIACGKGHEQSMCFGTIEYPWDDRVALRAALAEHLGISGPRMPELPTSHAANG